MAARQRIIDGLQDVALDIGWVLRVLDAVLMGGEREKLEEAREIVLHLKTLEEERAQ